MSRRVGVNEQSSESDEESSTRHDRFKSERFQESNSHKSFGRGDHSRFRNDDKYRSRSFREKSPLRSHRHKESTSSYSFRDRSESKNDHDRKEKRHHSKSKSSKDKKPCQHSAENISVAKLTVKSSKTNLSSLLKNFDEKTESKRNNSDDKAEIGPVLPPKLRNQLVESRTDSEERLAGPIHSPQIRKSPSFRDLEKPSKNKESDSASADEPTSASLSIESKCENKSIKDKISSLELEGPALPPNLCQNERNSKILDPLNSECPVSPSNLQQKQVQNNPNGKDLSDAEQDGLSPALHPKVEPNTYGPALPPKPVTDSYGPALPPQLSKSVLCGPSLPKEGIPENTEESDEDDVVGPLPEGKMTLTQYQLNLRAMDIKRKIEEEKSGTSKVEKKREEWMLELPPEKAANIGLGPRSFRMREAPDMSNRSSWTDTPADTLRKEQQAAAGVPEPVNSEEMMKMAFVQERNEAMDKMSKRSREEDRPKSLLEIHQKKLKKKKKKEEKEEKEGKKKERRPFDRNIDLQVNRFDDAQKKSIFKKAQLLDTRFSSGESKYL